MEHRNPGTEILIAEGCDGNDTFDIYDEFGYKELSEKYGIGLIDLNGTDIEEIRDENFVKFSSIHYPKILLESFIISLPTLGEDEELGMTASIDNMLGAFPASHYKGFFSVNKNKLKNIELKHQIHDIVKCKMPNFAIIDASEHGNIIAGRPFEMDKQAAKLLGKEWVAIPHLNLIHDSFSLEEDNPEGSMTESS